MIDDPLKELEDVMKPDIRQEWMLGDLPDYHNMLSRIHLDDTVHVDVRQLFETAKNVSLYSYFVYRFHQVSEVVAYSALELALKKLYALDRDGEVKSQGMCKLFFYAKKRGWIDNGYFSDLESATRFGIQLKRRRIADKEIKNDGQIKDDPLREINASEIEEGVRKSAAVDGLIYYILDVRNDLAHGSSKLMPSSISVLDDVSSIVNYIYRKFNNT